MEKFIKENWKVVITGFVLLGIVLIAYNSISSQPSDTTLGEISTSQELDNNISMEYLSNEETETVYFDFLSMLSDMYFVSQQASTEYSDDLTSFMSELMKANNTLEEVILRANSYANHKNQIVELAGKGVVVGASEIKEANINIINYLRGLGNFENFDVSEMGYQMANYRATENKGYKTVIISTGQLSSLTFRFATSENPTGQIPYTISKDTRQRILKQIDELFGEAFVKDDLFYKKTQKRNAVLVVVRSLRDNLKPDTYEEIRK